MRTLSNSPLVIAVLSLGLLVQGCNKNQSETSPSPKTKTPEAAPVTAAPPVVPAGLAERTSFQEVTAQLDPGGSLYAYLSTEQLVQGLGDRISSLRQAFTSLPNIPSDQRNAVDKIFRIVSGLVQDSGIEDVSGFGASSVAREPALYHTKVLMHHYRGKGTGFLWTMLGQKPHALHGMNLLPESTAMVYYGDLDVPLFWSVIQRQVLKAGFPEAEQALAKLPEAFEQGTGLKWDKVLDSLGGEFGFALMLDPKRKISIPTPEGGLEIPEPSLMVIAKTKDDTIFNRLETLLNQTGQQVDSVDKPNLKMRTLPLALPLPIQLRPTIASSEGYLFIANSDTVIEQVLAVKSGSAKGLKATPEFQKLSKDLPQEGNQFSFVSRRFGETISYLQEKVVAGIAQRGDPNEQGAQVLQLLIGTNASFSCSVSANTEQGWLGVMNGNQHPARLVLAAGIVPAAMLSAIAIPNFIKARQTSMQHACGNNLRQIQAAKQMWALDHKKGDSDTPSQVDLVDYFPEKRFPTCPSGGNYSINSMSQQPTCSTPGHALAQ